MKSQDVLPLNLEPALATFRQTNTNAAHRLLVATSARPQDEVTQGITRAAHQGPAPCPRRESPSECERRGRGCRAAEASNAFEGADPRNLALLQSSSRPFAVQVRSRPSDEKTGAGFSFGFATRGGG